MEVLDGLGDALPLLVGHLVHLTMNLSESATKALSTKSIFLIPQ